jgi:hypothetical protein
MNPSDEPWGNTKAGEDHKGAADQRERNHLQRTKQIQHLEDSTRRRREENTKKR